LIVANYDYEGDDDLVGPRQDAVDMYEKLRSLGFDVPPPVTNATKQQMEQAIREFVQRMASKDPGGANVFYYSGHGVQINGVNYLLPVRLANTSSEIDVEYNAVRLDYVANLMYSVVNDFNFLIIDACRNNPLLRRWNRPKGPGSQGLAFIAPPPCTMIAYATESGEVARDGDDNSPFTASLLNYLDRPGINIYQMLHQVRDNVFASTNQEQRPTWEGSPNAYDFSFNPGITTATTPAPQPTPRPPRPTLTPQPTLISSATGVNYQPLQEALAAGDFKLANQTTYNLMLRAADRGAQDRLRYEDVQNSCEDLNIIDQLWLNNSDGKFGFRVQQQIYQSLGGTLWEWEYNTQNIWHSFGNEVGWRRNDQDLAYSDLDFGPDVPSGHFPALAIWVVFIGEQDPEEWLGFSLPFCGSL